MSDEQDCGFEQIDLMFEDGGATVYVWKGNDGIAGVNVDVGGPWDDQQHESIPEAHLTPREARRLVAALTSALTHAEMVNEG